MLGLGQVSKGASTTASVSTTAVNTAEAGSLFVVLVSTDRLDVISTPTDNKGNTYTLVSSVVTSAGPRGSVYHCINGVGGTSHQVTGSLSSGAGIVVLFMEITGALQFSLVDRSGAQEDDTSPFTSPSITTLNRDDFLFASFTGNSATTPATHAISSASPSGGWTIPAGSDETDATFWTSCLAYQIVTDVGTYSSGFTEAGGASDCIAGILAHKARYYQDDATTHPKHKLRRRAQGTI